jgi:hypothetical protein
MTRKTRARGYDDSRLIGSGDHTVAAKSERSNHTLQSTAVVNEAFLRLLGSESVELQNRTHFIGIASRLVRQILVDYARSRRAGKREVGFRIDIEALAELPIPRDAQLLVLDDALESPTLERDWAVARLWLRRQMDGTLP